MIQPLRILLIEDNPSDVELVLIALRRGGIDPSWKRVETAKEMEAALADGPWDAILSDYNMPMFSAEEALKIVRSEDLVTPFLVVSGAVGEDVAVGLMRAGANDYVLKQNLARLAPALGREFLEAENIRARKGTEEAMRASEVRYRRLFEAAQDGILIVDPVSRQIVDANTFLMKLLGYSREELVGKELWEIGLFQDIEANKKAFQSLKGLGYLRYDHLPLKTKDGRRIEVEFVSNIYDVGGTQVVQCNIRDISEQRRADKALKKSESEQRQLVEQLSAERSRLFAAQSVAKIGSWETDLITMATTWSAETFRIFETAPEKFKPTHQGFLELVHPDDRAAVDGAFRQSLGEGTPYTIEHRLLLPGNLIKYVEQRWQTIRFDDGRPSRAVGTSQDITERKWASEMLNTMSLQTQRRERMLTTMLSSISDDTYLFNQNGQFLFANQRMLDMWGIKLEEAVGKSYFELGYPDETAKRLQRQIQKVFETKTNITDEIAYTNLAGIEEFYEYIFSPAFAEDGTVEFVVGCTRDVSERRWAEKALRASEAEFRALAESVPNLVWNTGEDGRCSYLNPQWMKYTGATLEDSIGDGWIEAFHPEDRTRAWNAWNEAMATSSTYSVEVRLRRADGVYRWWLVRCVPHRDAAGNILKWFGTCTDIDDLKQAEAGRTELLNRLTLQIERMPLACIQFDADFRVTDWNPAAELIFGYSKKEALGLEPKDLIPPSFESGANEIMDRVRLGEQRADSVNENVTKDGRIITCEWFNTPLKSEDGHFIGLHCLAQDITERKNAVAALHLRDRAILAVTQGLLITDPGQEENPIIFVSPGFERITGYGSAEVLGRDCRFLQGKDTDPAAAAQMRSAIQAGEPCSVELLNYRKDGTPFWNQLSISPVRDSTGTLTHFVGVQTDVTARRTLEDQFRQAQKMDAFGQLAGGVAHDFNNLLTIIIGYSDMLLRSLKKEDPSRKLIAEIHKAGELSAVLTRQLLAFSRQQVLAPRVLNLNDIVADTDKMLRRMIGEDVRLTTSLSSKLWAVRVDPGQIEQVLLNLAVNARDSMPTGGQLTIETENVDLSKSFVRTHRDAAAGPHVLLSVTDTGTGMSPEVQARIFEPFFTTKSVGQGTGLGLATVFGIVNQSGGLIEVDSEVGVGTTFKIFLPRVEEAIEDLTSSSRALIPPRGTETLLLVEDELGVRALTRHVLVACGYSVLEAADGNEANRVAARHDGPLDMLISDVVMPGAGGRVVAESIVERFPDIRVLFMSGYTDDAVIRHGVFRERVNFLQKPFTPFSLAVKVREVLDALKSDQPTKFQ